MANVPSWVRNSLYVAGPWLFAAFILVPTAWLGGSDREAPDGEARFQQWVAWRTEHCGFSGVLGEGGRFVCPDGLRVSPEWDSAGKERHSAPPGWNGPRVRTDLGAVFPSESQTVRVPPAS